MKSPMLAAVTVHDFETMAFHWSRMSTNQMVELSVIIYYVDQSKAFVLQLRTNQIASWKRSHDSPPQLTPPPPLLAFCNREMSFLANDQVCVTILRAWLGCTASKCKEQKRKNRTYFIRFLRFCCLHFDAVHRWLGSFE